MSALSSHRYQTRQLGFWQRAKEIRLNYYREIATAREEGKLLTTGSLTGPSTLVAGLGPCVHLGGEPYGASIAADPAFSIECAEAVESRGFARDLCAYMRNYWGSMFLDRYYFGGPFPKPDFCIQLHVCDSHGKWYQLVSEHLGIPYFGVDFPVCFTEGDRQVRQDYLVNQMLDSIEWMEKVTGRQYNDELLIEAVRNECLSSSLWGEAMCLNKAVPAPLDQKSIFSLYVVGGFIKHRKEAVDFYQQVRDEVKERVADGIAAVPSERCRLVDDGQPPWYFLRLYRYLEQYGAVVVGSWYTLFLFGHAGEQPDGTWGRAKTPEEMGMPLNSREDAVRALVWWHLDKPNRSVFGSPQGKAALNLRFYKEWGAQGMIMHLNRGCEGLSMFSPEIRLFLLEHGVPVVAFEHNMADKREFDEAQVMDRLDAFMESLDLKKLED